MTTTGKNSDSDMQASMDDATSMAGMAAMLCEMFHVSNGSDVDNRKISSMLGEFQDEVQRARSRTAALLYMTEAVSIQQRLFTLRTLINREDLRDLEIKRDTCLTAIFVLYELPTPSFLPPINAKIPFPTPYADPFLV